MAASPTSSGLSQPSKRLTRMSSTKALVAPGRTRPGITIIRLSQATTPIAVPQPDSRWPEPRHQAGRRAAPA